MEDEPPNMIRFFVHGVPKGQPRPRSFAMKTKSGGYTARVYDPGTAEGWKSQIAMEAEKHRPDAVIEGSISLHLSFMFPRPKSHFRTGKHSDELKEDAPIDVIKKPDLDNLAKAVMDALTQIGGFWKDDSQVSGLVLGKTFGKVPGVFIYIHHNGND